jgi:predicted glycosyltransferase
MRVWVDVSAPAHVLVLRPLIERLRAAGHDLLVTSRAYTQTQELLALHGIDHTPIGRHGGASRLRKLVRLVDRTTRMRRFGRQHAFDLALAHGSNDLAIAARLLKIPEANMHDYEYAVLQHHVGCRLAARVIFPDSVPIERLRVYGAGLAKLRQYPGLKEEYYLADFEPREAVLDELGVDRERLLVVLRPPPEVSLYHRKANPLFPEVLMRMGNADGVQAVVLPRTEAQRRFVTALNLPSAVVPPGAIDAQSLIGFADLVVSAGGTMNREAAALGTPAYTTYGGRMGGVDEALIRANRLRPLTSPDALVLERRPPQDTRVRRDPGLLLDLVLGTIGADDGHP